MKEKFDLFIFGASSELSKEILKNKIKFRKIILFSTKDIKEKKKNVINFKVKDYHTRKIKKVLNTHLTLNSRIIIFMGLNDNKLFGTLNDKEINNYLRINLIYHIKILNLLLINYKKFKIKIFILSSTFTKIRSIGSPIYSSSKIFLEKFVSKMSKFYNKFNVKLCIIRIGLIEAGLKKRIDKFNENKLYAFQKNRKITKEKVLKRLIEIFNDKRKKNFYKIY
tara:strand:- start:253 stop:921 length:669 start_codon:yes stop_codon:yes gene_type:complete